MGWCSWFLAYKISIDHDQTHRQSLNMWPLDIHYIKFEITSNNRLFVENIKM